jgi:hypothetical protein
VNGESCSDRTDGIELELGQSIAFECPLSVNIGNISRAALMAAMSIFFMPIIASKARFASSPQEVSCKDFSAGKLANLESRHAAGAGSGLLNRKPRTSSTPIA